MRENFEKNFLESKKENMGIGKKEDNSQKEEGKSKEKETEKREKSVEKLEGFLKKLSENLKRQGLPVNETCRVQTEAFSGIYPPDTIEKDEDRVKQIQGKWIEEAQKEKGWDEKELKKRMRYSEGRKLEMFKTAIFNKLLGERFITVRTSLYDDIVNKVDNIILEKNTGNVICALDEVESPQFENLFQDLRYLKKREETQKRNKRWGGATLRYGLRLEKENDKIKVKLGKMDHIPVFYLVLGEDNLEKGVKEFIPSMEESSDFENKLLEFFIASMEEQNRSLMLDWDRIPLKTRERINEFNRSLTALKENLKYEKD